MGAQKKDKGKNRIELIPSEFIEEVAKVLTMGSKKYGEHNWRKGLKWSKIYGAIQRHILAWNKGEDLDSESGLSHLTHAATNILILMEYSKTHKKLDDRYIINKIEKK